MAFYLVTVILLIALAAVLSLQWRLNRQIVNAQLETHKMMFPSQIRSARKTYVRGLQRQARGVRAWRIVAIVLSVLAAIGLFIALSIHYQAALPMTGLDALTQLMAWFIAGVQNLFLVPAMVLALVAIGLGFYLAHWRYHALKTADDKSQGGPQDLYWTPPALLKRQYQLKQILLGLLAALSVFLLVSGVADWIPTPAGNLAKVKESTTIKRTIIPAESSSTDSSATSSEATSSSSSVAGQSTTTEYPIDVMKKAALAPASALTGLTEADHAALLFMEYWTLNDLDTATIAKYTQDKNVSYAYHTVTGANGNLIVFSQTYTINGEKTQTYMFYGWLNGEESRLYNMYDSKTAITSLAQQYGITVSGNTVKPKNVEIRDSVMNLRQLVSAFTSYHDYQTVKKGLQHGAAIPLQ
ncbi:hypothetical protein [Lacticaseibacillus salsurivasis]|uniref:hypothetical protein n=1 Tax=Lacticaseibacillus salsurivasis TaxID=3081441 RepID=UPI0030C6E95D